MCGVIFDRLHGDGYRRITCVATVAESLGHRQLYAWRRPR
jgi:hypothetical protein